MDTSRGGVSRAEVKVGLQGRVVIPARMREELKIEAGDELMARIEDGGVVLEKRENVLKRVRERFAAVPKEASLVDGLISDRRKEAREEGGL